MKNQLKNSFSLRTVSLSYTFSRLLLLVLSVSMLVQCSQQEEITPSSPETTDPTATDDARLAATTACATCTYVVPSNTYKIDGKQLGLKPGSVICLQSGRVYKSLLFVNLVGTPTQPIVITNCGGSVNIHSTGLSCSIKTENCKYFRLTGESAATYGIKIYGSHIGVSLDYLSTNFEVDHLEVQGNGFAGIMAKTDPTCDDATIRGNFTMRDISIHDNYVHDTGGEGFYIGNSFYLGGMSRACGIRMPHAIEGVKIYNNIAKNTGWEGIQLGSATKGAAVYNNRVENYGTKNVVNQRNGMQLGEGTGGLCYNNFIKGGPGNGMVVLGLGDNLVHDNIIVDAGSHGIFCDERYTTGPGFKFINNTIINPKEDGIRIFADLVPMNVIANNIIVHPGSYGTYKAPRTVNDSYIYKLSSAVKVQVSNNYFTQDIKALNFVSPFTFNFRLNSSSPVINQGLDVSAYNIATDYYGQTRRKGPAFDIGAAEY